MKKTIRQHLVSHVTTIETYTTNIGIRIGFHWQTTHVEYAYDVVPLHNIVWYKSSPTITQQWEVEVLWFQILDQQLPQLRFEQF